ncbi:MAG: phosphatidate cytidylyltransferase [Oscillospiraceae bacterium]|nr:phosphatidate cytidylyltransferase [Oscillospiraceae bacterium]
MLTRILTGAAALIAFVPVLFFSHTPVFDIVIALISLLGTLELLKCAGVIKKYALSLPSLAAAFFAPLLFRYAANELIPVIFAAYLFYLLFASVFTRKNNSTNDMALCFFSAVFVSVSFTAVIITRELARGDILYLLIFIGAWSTDTFAYFTGKFLGRHKLPGVLREVSPNKTVEGVMGGVIFCALAFVLYGFIIEKSNRFGVSPDYITLACSGVLVSAAAQLGDLSMSAIKRNYGVKDYGAVFPGHGGVLDRFDSVMAAAAAVMIIGKYLKIFSEVV